jgi:hypothetical protein
LQAAPNAAEHSLSLGMSYWLYFLSILYPVSFGRVFYFAFIISLIFGIFLLLRRIILRKPSFIGIINRNRYPAVLFLVVFSYALSLLPMRTGALSNRLVPLIPFMAIVVVCFATYLYKKIDNKIGKGILIILICLFFLIQFIESYAWFSLKVENNSRAVASKWIIKNIKQGTIIGLENIPIYQLMPDVILKEFYLKQYGRGQANMFNYVIVSSQTKTFPKVVILTNDYVESKYLITSEKKLIVEHLRKQDYRQIKTFTIQSPLFSFFNDRLEYYMASIMPLPDTISIYEKQ